MDDSLSGDGNTSSVSCDSCIRAYALCIGGPRCERCFLNGFECIFSPGEANILELKSTFASLLLPGQALPEKFPNAVNTGSTMASAWNENENGDESAGRRRRGSGRCAVCRQLRKRCGKERPKCRSCEDEGFECGYEVHGHGVGEIGPEAEVDQAKHSHGPTDSKMSHGCDTCKVWKALCDNRHPTCSSCQLRGVECRYTPIREGSSGDATLPKTMDQNVKRPPKHAPAPTKSWQTPSLPPSLSSYYNPPPPMASPVSRPLPNMYSTPSGCISCFESKEKCLPLLLRIGSEKPTCFRCNGHKIECKPFPTGTKLIACDACTRSYRLCTNYKEGLRCDGCDEAGLECSRTSPVQSTVFPSLPSKPAPAPTSSKHPPPPPPQAPKRSCETCRFLTRDCDEKTPRCSVCEEVGAPCRYPAWVVPIVNSSISPRLQKPEDMTCHSCKELDLVCDGALPTCFYCKELGRECQRGVVGAHFPPIESSKPLKYKPLAFPKPTRPTGHCSTCKARKTRCDEQRPTCQNCKLSGFVCCGYQSGSGSESEAQPQPEEKGEVMVKSKEKAKEQQPQQRDNKLETETKTKTVTKVEEQARSGESVKTENTQKKQSMKEGEAVIGSQQHTTTTTQKVKDALKNKTTEKAKEAKAKEEQTEEEEQDEWETITHTEALGDGKPGEFGVVELD